jgi:hypothetical protein
MAVIRIILTIRSYEEGKMMYYCTQCGKEFEEGYRYCPYCGNPLTSEKKEASPEKSSILKSRKVLKKALFWFIVGMAVLGLIFAVHVLLLKPPEVALFPMEFRGKWGFMDKTARVVIEPKYDLAGWFSEGLAAVMVEGKWGYIDPSGKFVIEPKFDAAGWFEGGRAQVQLGDQWEYIDRSGRVVWELTE